MKAGKVDSRPGHRRRQPGNEVQGFENDVGGTVPARCLELVALAHAAILRE